MSEVIAELAEALCDVGVRAAFGVPGSGASWQLITALEDRGVSFRKAGHEAAAVIMAGAYATQSASLGCAIGIKGPGLANMLPGIVSNAYEHWAGLTVSEAYSPEGATARMHKRLDHRGLTLPIVKAYAQLGEPGLTVRRLADRAKQEIPGPVHLDLTTGGAGRFDCAPTSAVSEGPGETWSGVAQALERAKAPVVIAGSLARRARLSRQIGALSVPVFTTAAAKGVVDERLPIAAGVFTGEGKALSPERVVLPRADLIVGLGLRSSELLSPELPPIPLLMLDVGNVTNAGDGFGAAARFASFDAGDFDAALDLLREKRWGAALVAESAAAIRAYLTRDPWLPGRLIAMLDERLPEACLVCDTGAFCTVAEHVWRAKSSDRFVASANGRFMGTGLPMAIGVALADRTRPTVCAVGDGGLPPYVSELKQAIEERLPLLVLFLSDGRYGSLVAAASAPALSRRAVTFARPSWYQAVEALGCTAVRVDDSSAAAAAIDGWRRDAPLFIEAVFDRERYAAMTADVR